MKRSPILHGLLLGLVATLPLLGLFLLIAAVTPLPAIPFEVFNWISRVLPGPIITFGIDTMIDTLRLLGMNVADTAKLSEQIMAFGMVLAAGTLAGTIYAVIFAWRNWASDVLTGLIAGFLVGLPTAATVAAITQSNVAPWLIIAYVVGMWALWGLALHGGYTLLAPAFTETKVKPASDELTVEQTARREFLVKMGGASAAITVVGSGVGLALMNRERRFADDDSMAHEIDEVSDDSFPNSNDPVSPVPGTRPEYTPLKDHYKVFISTEPSVIDGDLWALPVSGLVTNPLILSLADFMDRYESIDQYVTLSCISGRIATSLIGTTLWTGVPVREVLQDAGLQSSARYLDITSADGFHEIVDLDLIRNDPRIMFCYAWDGQTLPVDHGFPLRIYIPDRYGMKQPKWITSVEVTDTYREGYWVERNWSEEAIMNATSVIDTVAVDAAFETGGEMVIPIGGIAHAGARGIAKVEVRIDGGQWTEAKLRAPLSETTWVIWRYDWPFTEGNHTFEVRCAEGDGTPQIEEPRDARPDGSTGIHSVEETIRGQDVGSAL